MTSTKKPEDKQREEAEQVERCYSRLFETEDGKKVLKDLEANCFVNITTYGSGANQMDMNINEGCRRVFLHIISRMKMTMTEFYLNREKQQAESKL